MKRAVLTGILIVLVVFLALWAGNFNQNSQKNDVFSRISTITGLDQKNYRGGFFLVHFWAKWCAPCTEEIPHLVEFAKKAEKELKGLKILAISLDESIEVSQSILPDQGKGLPSNLLLLLDSAQKLPESLGSYQYPETYLFDPQGKILEKWVGPQKWDKPEVILFFKKRMVSNP